MTEPFIKLADPSRYVACDWDLTADSAGRTHWVGFFKRHLETLLRMGVDECGGTDHAQHRAATCRAQFARQFDHFERCPSEFGRVSIIELGRLRNQILRAYGFDDCFAAMKQRENEQAIQLLPQVCRHIDMLSGEVQIRAIVEGVFAGNIFDMGAEATASRFLNGGGIGFFETRGKLPGRPWLVDDYDAFVARTGPARGPGKRLPWRKCIYFVDNAGSDFVLGVVPMIRWLAQNGTQVVIAANEKPTLNDMTVAEANQWWPRLVEVEPTLADLPTSIVSTGTSEPLIDLSAVSPELNNAAHDADLVVLEGMGRGVESNLDAAFSCDALNLAMLKDEVVAQRIGGKIYDVVCRFR